jgi:aminoglycoside phosphotransferase
VLHKRRLCSSNRQRNSVWAGALAITAYLLLKQERYSAWARGVAEKAMREYLRSAERVGIHTPRGAGAGVVFSCSRACRSTLGIDSLKGTRLMSHPGPRS